MRSHTLLIAALLFAPFSSAFASSFTGIVAFGDSLTDNGNAYIASKGLYPGANYGQYTFSNGLTTQYFSDGSNTTPKAAGPAGLWIDQLATKLGVADPLPALAGGSNYAVAGAETGSSNSQDMYYQVALYIAAHPSASSTALYTFWGGANDILDGNSPITAADNIESYIETLHGAGAAHFLWMNLPLLGDTPEGSVDKTALNEASLAFDGEWAKDLAALKSQGIAVTGVDIGSLFSAITSDPSAHGFTNVTQSAQTQTGLANDAGYLFWDGLHPTTQGHAAVADTAYAALTATSTPEPGSLGMIGIGAAAVMFFARRRAQK